jgi:hypothetical protein
MATTKMGPDKKAKTEAKAVAKSVEPVESNVGGIAAADLDVLDGSIDSRMKALLKDHQKMGARPK